jgi:hypothetical protein
MLRSRSRGAESCRGKRGTVHENAKQVTTGGIMQTVKPRLNLVIGVALVALVIALGVG